MAEEERLPQILERLERVITRRLVIAAERSPETFLEEVSALESVIDLRKKLMERSKETPPGNKGPRISRIRALAEL